MSGFYSDIAGIAAGVLKEFGAPIKLRKQATGSYDPTTGRPVLTYQDFPAYGAIADYTSREINGTNVLVGDRRVIMSDPGQEVLPGDLLLIGDAQYKVVISRPTNPAGVAVVLDVQVRQ